MPRWFITTAVVLVSAVVWSGWVNAAEERAEIEDPVQSLAQPPAERLAEGAALRPGLFW